ncbi:MAG: menaquinone biosynthesis protein [Aureliella sp.]
MSRIGAVRYLNTKPLIYGLRQRLPECELHFDLPSRLADRLAASDLDVALIPSVEFLRSEDVTIISDACIGCVGPVRSVRILFRRPASEVKSLALDEGSRTSAILSQVLLRERVGCRPELRPFPIESSVSDVDADAVLVIGDRAMNVDVPGVVDHWDLGQSWHDLTGLPFVFAMWIAPDSYALNDSLADRRLASALEASRNAGLSAAAELAEKHHASYGITEQECLEYFQKHLEFTLGERELSGLSLFRKMAIEMNLLPTHSQNLSLQPL